jgi:pilus assembly protein FimV
MRQLTKILALIGTLVTLDVHALGLGHIQLDSKLNEPLNAKIALTSIPKGSLSSLKVGIASASAFQRAGLERPHLLTTLEFTVQPTSKTEAVVHLNTQEPLKEPFLNFIVEVTWSSGRLLREYTVLLDPPLYKKQPHMAPLPPTSAAQKTPAKLKPEQETSNVEEDFYTVVQNDTLWKIAEKTRPNGISIQRHMNNIYNANPDAFINKDMALIKIGEVIRIPGWTNTERSTPTAPAESGTSRLIITTPEPTAQTEIESNTAPVEPLENEITQLTEDNVSLESENQPLTTEQEMTNDLVVTIKKQLDEQNKMLALQNQQLAELQAQLEKQRQENQQFKEELVNRASSADKTQVAVPTPQPEASVPAEQAPEQASSSPDKTQVAVPTEPEQASSSPDKTQVPTQPLDKAAELKNLLQTHMAQKLQEDEGLKEQLSNSKSSPEELAELMAESGIDPLQEDSPEKVAKLIMELGDEPLDKDLQEVVAEMRELQQGSLKDFVKLTAELQVQKLQESSPEEQAQLIAQLRSAEPSFITSSNDWIRQQVPGGWITILGIVALLIVIFLILLIGLRRKSTEEKFASKAKEDGHQDDEAYDQYMEEEINRYDIDPAYDQDLHEKVKEYMDQKNFGQAEKLVFSALEQYPRHHEYRLTLLEIYAAAKEVDKFEKQAKRLHDAVGGQGPLWEKALELWQDLSPGQELFSQERAEITAAAMGAGAVGIAAATLGGDETPNERLVIPSSDSEDELLFSTEEELNEDVNLSEELKGVDAYSGVNTASEDSAETDYSDLEQSLDGDEDSSALSLDEDWSPEDRGEEGSVPDLSSLELDEDLPSETGEEGSAAEDLSSLELDEDLPSETGEEGSVPDLSSLELDEDLPSETGEEGSAAEELSSLELDEDLPSETGEEGSAAEELSSLELDEDLPSETGEEGSAAEELSSLELDEDLPSETGEEGSAAEELSSLELDEDLPSESGEEDSVPDLSSLELDEDLPSESGEEDSVPDLSSLELDEDLPSESGEEDSVPDLSSLELDEDLPSEIGEEGSAAEELSSLELDEDLPSESGEEDSVPDLSSLELDEDLPFAEESSAADELSLEDDLSLEELLNELNTGDTDSQQDTVMEDDDLDLNALALDKEPGDEYEFQADTNDAVGDKISENFELAQIYMDMDDNDSARDILKEILEQGDDEQKRKAQELIAKLS